MTETKVSVKCNGKVVALNKKAAQIVTIAEDRTGKKYETAHTVKIGKNFNKPEVGDYLAITGHLESEAGVNWIEPVTCEIVAEPADQNMYAWVEGEAPSSFFEPKSLNDEFASRQPFGIASVKLSDTKRQRGVVFNTLIAKFRENLKAGAIVRLAGRLQYRTYQNKETGADMTVAEIICNNEWSKVIKPSARSNPFSFGSDEPDMSAFGKAE